MTAPAISHAHVCVWIDHDAAKVFRIGPGTAEEAILHEPGPHHHIHRKADHVGKGKAPPDQAFLDEVAEALAGAGAILIAGPGQARNELAAHLHHHHPAIARRVWGIEPMDHPTDREIVAAARKYFHAADRMHA